MPLRRGSECSSRVVRFGKTSFSLDDAFQMLFVEKNECDNRAQRIAFDRHRHDEAASYRKTIGDMRFTAEEDARILEYLSACSAAPAEADAPTTGADEADEADQADQADALVAKCKKGVYTQNNQTERDAYGAFASHASYKSHTAGASELGIGFHKFIAMVRDAGTVAESFPERKVLELFLRHSDPSTGLASFPGFVAALSELAVAGGRTERSGILSVTLRAPDPPQF